MLGLLLILLLIGFFLALGVGMLLTGLHLSLGRSRPNAVRVVGGIIAVLGAASVLFGAYIIFQLPF